MNRITMKYGATYQVTRKIKTHTSPLRTVTYDEVGRFIKETSNMLVFDTFRVKKSTIISIKSTDKISVL